MPNSRSKRTLEDKILRVEYKFRLISGGYEYRRKMSQQDQKKLVRYGEYLIGLRDTRATDLAYEILGYMSKFKNTGIGVIQ